MTVKKGIGERVQPLNMKPVGILGGGQLARMMALKAHEMGLKISVLSENESDPAAQVASLWTRGSLKDRASLLGFLQSCSVVTFESEFMDARLLADLERESGTPIFPNPGAMELLQDRLTQKELLEKHGLPTAPFCPVETPAQTERVFAELGGQVVFKKRRFGYDGYGTFVVRSKADLETFLPELEINPHGFIGEAFVPFRRELAVMIGRSRGGKTVRLPFVETFQENSRCLWVKGPLRESTSLANLGKKLEGFLRQIGYVGIMGVELFEAKSGILVNELAPRVHNSAHYSLDGLTEDQFSIHLKAVLGHEILSPSARARGFAMMNLLGTKSGPPEWRLPADVRLHWYGKSENRVGRKMGHINSLAETPERALAIVKRRRVCFDV